jgi:hypothetical protein
MADSSNVRRAERVLAVRRINTLAQSCGFEVVKVRPSVAELTHLYGQLCGEVADGQVPELDAARKQWAENGGCDLDASLLPEGGEEGGASHKHYYHYLVLRL